MREIIPLLVGIALCLPLLSEGGSIFKLDIISDKYSAVIFDHEKHKAMTGCSTCHHQHGTGSGAKIDCRNCHKMNEQEFRRSVDFSMFTGCRNCHPPMSSSESGILNMPGLKAAYHRKCFTCHDVAGNPLNCTKSCHTERRILWQK